MSSSGKEPGVREQEANEGEAVPARQSRIPGPHVIVFPPVAGAPSADEGPKPRARPASSGSPSAGIDHGFISREEDNQQIQGYVPVPKTSQSGVTIATGVDLGQLSAKELDSLDIPQELKEQLRPYLGLKKQAALDALDKSKGGKKLIISKPHADALDRAVHERIINGVKQHFDKASDVSFDALASEAQTVIADVAIQYGPDLARRAPKFWKAVTEGRWEDALKELRDFGDRYGARRKREADLLQKAIDRHAFDQAQGDEEASTPPPDQAEPNAVAFAEAEVRRVEAEYEACRKQLDEAHAAGQTPLGLGIRCNMLWLEAMGARGRLSEARSAAQKR